MRHSTTNPVAIMSSCICLLTIAQVASAQATEYFDAETWEVAAGDFVTIGFDEVPSPTWLSDQYAKLGVLFTGGADQAQCCDLLTFPIDGAGVSGFESIELTFLEPMSWIAVDFPGDAMIDIFMDEEWLYSSSGFGEGGIGNFGGLVSTRPFNRAVITDPTDAFVFIDDLHFGPSIPAPAALPLLGTVLLQSRRRRL